MVKFIGPAAVATALALLFPASPADAQTPIDWRRAGGDLTAAPVSRRVLLESGPEFLP